MTADLEEVLREFSIRSRPEEMDKLSHEEKMRFFARWEEFQASLEQALAAKAQAEGKFPFGFLPVFHYENNKGENARIRDNVVRVRVTEGTERRRRDDLEFYVEGFKSEDLPVLPLRGHGEIWSVGWDIPTQWAVDASGRAWKDNAHGGPMGSCTQDALLSEARCSEDSNALQTLHKLFGKKPPLPEWARAALSAGWTPPGDFNRSEYE